MRALNQKLVRDLYRMRGMVAAIAIVIASGVSVLIMSLGALHSLEATAAAYYERSRFAHVFASLKRAPERVGLRIAGIEGVQFVQTRIVEIALLDVAGFVEPVIGQIVSIPDRGEPLLNRLTLRSGRMVAPGRVDEVVISEAFAEGHGLAPGDSIAAVIHGHRRELSVVGTALSPEFVYAIGPGALMPDEQRFGILWMSREALAAATDLDGAFNDVSLALLRGTDPREVIDRVDQVLAPYGGIGAYDRGDQISNWFLMSEIDQLANLARILPAIFLAVAAFLTNMVLDRMIAIERSEIGLLKAFGYSNLTVGWHYVQLVLTIGALGIALGFALGWWFGWSITGTYAEFYRFPYFFFQPPPKAFVIAAGVSLLAALAGTIRAVRRAVRLPPAEAMRPPSPALYTRAGLMAAIETIFDQPTRMIFRQIVRWPGRSFATIFGVAMAVGLLVTSLQWSDAIEHLVDVQFNQSQRHDATVGLVEARSSRAVRGLERLPGVLAAEPVRFVPVRFRNGPLTRRESIEGIPSGARLGPAFDAETGAVPVPPDGLLMSTKLAELLDARVGDTVTVEVLEGRRPVREIPVAGLFETYLGTPALMNLDALNRMMRQRPSVSAARLVVDPAREGAFFGRLKELPSVTMVMLRRTVVQKFHETMAETLYIFVGFFATFASALAFGVTYNATRIALSERARELATLRVLGLSPFEVSYILMGEVALLTLIGLPAGCAVGYGLSAVMAGSFETELYRVPLVIEPSTFGTAVTIVGISAVVSIAIVRRRLDRLDLVSVLKTRE